MTIWDFLALTWEWLTVEYEVGTLDQLIQRVRNIINITQQRAEQWWDWARKLAIWGTIISFVIFLASIFIGGFTHLGWPNSVAGLLIAPILFLLLAWWTPLVAVMAVIYEIAHGRVKCTTDVAIAQAKWWLGMVCGILLWQVLVSLAFTFIPYWNAPSRIPVLMLLALAIALIGIRWNNVTWYRSIIKFLVTGVFIAQVLVCFLPETSTALHSLLGKTDKSIAKKIENGSLFSAKATPPRDISWMTAKVETEKTDLFRAYTGDAIYYYANKGFWVEYEDGNKYFNNPSYNGQMMRFIITSAKKEGEMIGAWSEEPFQLKYKVESRG